MTTTIIAANDVPSRRTMFRQVGGITLSATAVALLAGCGTMTMGDSAKPSDLDILKVALDKEHEAIAAYQLGADSGLLQPAVLRVAQAFQKDHVEHAKVLSDTIRKLGGSPAGPGKYDFPVKDIKNQADVLAFAADLEQGAVSAYLGAVPVFTNRDLAKAAASILGAEAMHWAVLRNALGENPVPVSFVS
jgi:rubrerythrin